MEFFLVGGAVRDELLNYPVLEKDWVVVGASAENLLQQGFNPVGKDFPVFLHPETKEEYALARTERKVAPGYTGFQFHASPEVTLEEDLERRDLTINAIAKASSGEIIDPFGGREDINTKLLRHVSSAFVEDPVRILRVARFAARYHHLGFQVAPETMALMTNMVSSGEVDALVPERVWKELSRALCERHPEIFFETLKACGALAYLMPELDALFGVPQRPEHHPEIDCGIHTLMALQQACILSPLLTVRFATLLHDLGKGNTPEDILPRHIGHEARSLPLIKSLCERLASPKDCRDLALAAAEFHTHCHRALELKPNTLLKTLERLDALRRPERFEEFLLACEADARGRTGFEKRDYPQADYLRGALQSCLSITPKPLIESGLKGAEIGNQLKKLRVEKLKTYKHHYQGTP